MFHRESGGAMMNAGAMKTIVRQLFCAFALCGIGSVFVANASADSMLRPHGALSPSAPVRMSYELPDVLPVSGEMVLTLNLSTPLTDGDLSFEVISSEGVSIIAGANANCGLAHATQPIAHQLKLLLSSDQSRIVLVQVSVDGAMGKQSRSYRIDLSLPVTAQSTSKAALKLMPATIRQ
jgi:hypothetical protein